MESVAHERLPQSADEDSEARDAIWRAVCIAANDIRNRFGVGSIRGISGTEVRIGSSIPGVATWRLVEALSLLGIILRSEEASASLISVFGKTGPIKIREDGADRYVWSQQRLAGVRTSLDARPDLLVTSSYDPPNRGNVIRVIDAKCIRSLGTTTIRSEFGKAHDLSVGAYLIWSFYTPPRRIIEGARKLRIDLAALGFDTDRRKDLIEKPEALISHVAHSQEESRKAQRFAVALIEAGERARDKLLDS